MKSSFLYLCIRKCLKNKGYVGPLVRVETGEKQVQGTDYAYTLQGWAKTFNAYTTEAMLDIGQDGTGFEANARFARDAAALMLQYYDGDYTPVAGTGNFNLFSADAVGLYNGNIAALSTATDSVTPLLKLFRYDKLNRIKQMQTAGISAGEWGSPTDNFSTEYRYDYNGNILSLQRKDATAQIMHQINYTYNAKNNRLQGITATGINSSTYSYDAIGNLANDSGENIQVSWNAMNKVKQVNLPNNRQLQFSYSSTGQRQIKKTGDKTEYYLHDATGNIMCVYELSGKYLTVKERTIYGSKRIGVYRQRIRFGYSGIVGGVVIAPGSDLINILNPQPIISPDGRHYLEGSNRLQVIGVNRAIAQTSTISYTYKKGTAELKGLSPLMAVRPTFLDGTKTAGLRDYELTDHLSNVMAVISDRKLSVDTNSDTITDYYAPQVVSFTDYYPFGFPMAERSGNLAGYRFGFNGQESDGEIYGTKESYSFEFRNYDSRLGRWWGVDFLSKSTPEKSPYKALNNNPIIYMDPDGEKEYLTIKIQFASGRTIVIRKQISMNIMTDGEKYLVREFGSDASWSYENKYYDYENIITFVENPDGTITSNGEMVTKIVEGSPERDADAVWINGNKKGEVKRDWSEWLKSKLIDGKQPNGFYLVSDNGGVSPTKTKATKGNVSTINIDVLLAALNSLGGMPGQFPNIRNNPIEIAELINNIKDIVETSIEMKEQKSWKNPNEKVIVPYTVRRKDGTFYQGYQSNVLRKDSTKVSKELNVNEK